MTMMQLIMMNAVLWLLDEPFVHVDARMKRKMMQLIDAHRKKGNMVIIATHEMTLVKSYKMQEYWL